MNLSLKCSLKPLLRTPAVLACVVSLRDRLPACNVRMLILDNFAVTNIAGVLSNHSETFETIQNKITVLKRESKSDLFLLCLHLISPTCFILPTNVYHFVYIWV